MVSALKMHLSPEAAQFLRAIDLLTPQVNPLATRSGG
jgi:hypothetical protein